VWITICAIMKSNDKKFWSVRSGILFSRRQRSIIIVPLCVDKRFVKSMKPFNYTMSFGWNEMTRKKDGPTRRCLKEEE